MRKFIFPTRDVSLYEQYPNRNTGLDEILEIGKTDEGRYAVRSLLYFELPDVIPTGSKFDLVCHVAYAERIKRAQEVEICQMSQSWEEGSGYYHQDLLNSEDGATWTQSNDTDSWNSGSGGEAFLGTSLTSSLPLQNGFVSQDFTFDVTDIVDAWISGSENHGIAIKFPDVDESDTNNEGNIKIFSNQTHTIYKPSLVMKWDDQVYVTGSNAWPEKNLKVSAIVNPSYRQDELVRVDVHVREKYPQKTFATVLDRYSADRYLPDTSYYSIVDDLSGTVIIPFSDESKISSDGNYSYFSFYTQKMYPLRYYRILIKVVHDDVEEIFDNNTLFLVK